MDQSTTLKELCSNKQQLEQFRLSVDEFINTLQRLQELKKHAIQIEQGIKMSYGISPAFFKKVIKAIMRAKDGVLDREIAEINSIYAFTHNLVELN